MKFGLDAYHIVLAALGIGIVLSHWLPRFASSREPRAAALLIVSGAALFGWLPGMPELFDPVERGTIWTIVSEIAVIIALFGTGIRIDRAFDRKRWRVALRLLLVAMPLTITAIALLGNVLGLGLAAALLLGACLAPTDPVLAADLQVAPPNEGEEHEVRFTLTAEAGLNDALAFPFVYAAILLATGAFSVGEWLGFYVAWKIVIGTLVGTAMGWLLGKILFAVPRENPLSDSNAAVVALAGVFATYGLSELVEGYGFLAVFVMALLLRREEEDHDFHRLLHGFSDAIEHSLMAMLLVALGGALPILLGYLDAIDFAFIAITVLIIRPVFGWLALIGCDMPDKERSIIAFYGVRGIGSIFYIAYAAGEAQFDGIGKVWAFIGFSILASAIVHGLTAGFVLPRTLDDG
jgi:NhaP-type Na+/H+ or K+/H+ antiporter